MLYIGLDLATTNFGIAALSDRMDTVLLKQCSAKGSLDERIREVASIVKSEVDMLMAAGNTVFVGAETGPTHAAYAIGKLARLRGWVEASCFYKLGVSVTEVNLASARSFLLGKSSILGMEKEVVQHVVKSIVGRCPGEDAADAWVVANYIAATNGVCAFSCRGSEGDVQKTTAEAHPGGVPSKPGGATKKGRSRVPKP